MSRKCASLHPRFLLILFLFGFLFFGGISSLQGAEGEDRPKDNQQEEVRSIRWGADREIVRFGLGYYGFSGESSWRIGFTDTYGYGASTLAFKDQKGGMALFSLEIAHPQGKVAVGLQGGTGRIRGGGGTDTDFLNGSLYFQSRFETSGDAAFWAVDLRTAWTTPISPRWVIQPFLGWVHYRDEMRLSNGVWTTLYGRMTDRPFAGLDSRYTFCWDALRLGLIGEGDLAAPDPRGVVPFRLTGHFSVFPFVHYRGSGIWNLREDLRQDPSFTHEVDQGGLLGVEGALSLVYRPLPWLALEGGGRLFYGYARSGRDRTYFSNGTIGEADLEEVQTFRIGFFLQMNGRF